MAHGLRFTTGILIAGLAMGCGSGQKPPVAANSPDPVTPQPMTATESTTGQFSGETTPVTLSVNASSPPSDVVVAFLNAMRDGNSGVAAELLTDQAREETIKHQWPVQPPGAPSATYQLGEPRFVDAAQSGVHVPCLWTEADGVGGTIQFEVLWALRRTQPGWRVAGFASEIVPGKPPFYFNFEDIPNLKETQLAAEAALVEAAAVESAAQSDPAPANRYVR